MDIIILFKILCGFELVVFGWYMHVDVLILDKHRYAFCQLKNSGRLFIVKPQANTPSVIGVFGW